MLSEIESSVLRTRSIHFRPGLNVVLGDENATNSIGKSTLLLLVDFGLGGNTLLEHNTDLVQELGHHDYTFTFDFDEERYQFRRGTFQPDLVFRLTDGGEPEAMRLEEYTSFLRQAYEVQLPDISFRTLVSLFVRVWGKENLDVRRPLHIVQNQPASECIENLIKTFGRYQEIRAITEELRSVEKRRDALRTAVRNEIIPKIGRRQYAHNEARIEQLEAELDDIKANLAKYATNLSEIVNRDILQLKLKRDELSELRLSLANRLSRIQKNILGNRHIHSKHFESLREFVSGINEERLVKVEEFHDQMARLLRHELRESEKRIQQEIESVDQAITDIDSQMSSTLGSIKEPSVLVDHVFEAATSLRDAKRENKQFDLEQELKDSLTALRLELSNRKTVVLTDIERVLNDGIRTIVDRVFGPDRKSPEITLTESGYSYSVFDDTGTGTAYAGLIVFDLTIFQTTSLPVLLHDSLLFKNVENDSVARLVRVYNEIQKQSFIALDEIEKYGTSIAELLRSRSAIQLANDKVLYVKDWRRKQE